MIKRNKLDDIKLAASIHKSEVIGVSEVNFKCDNDNIGEENYNKLTTD